MQADRPVVAELVSGGDEGDTLPLPVLHEVSHGLEHLHRESQRESERVRESQRESERVRESQRESERESTMLSDGNVLAKWLSSVAVSPLSFGIAAP